MTTVTHVPLGEWVTALAARKGITGIVITNAAPVFWNVSKD
jgi:hypothetical protein